MSTIFKRLAAVMLVLLMVLSMAACKNNKETDAEKAMNTQAVTVGDFTLSAVELNYFYMDAISNWYSYNGSYALSMGLDPTKPLSQQVISSITGETWADSFLDMTKENIQSTYALYNAAMADNFTLGAADQAALDVVVEELEAVIEYYKEYYASYGYTYPYTDAANYLESIYGVGATPENYMAYCRICTIADAYYNQYAESLKYTDKELREYEADKYERYCSYSYTVYYLPASSFESAEAAEKTANELAGGTYADQAAFDEAIKALPIHADAEKPTLSEAFKSILYAQVNPDYVNWVAEQGRTVGGMGVVARQTTSGEETTVHGYYVLRFDGVSDNQFYLKNVRHLLVAFEGGTTNALTGVTTYSDAEKAAAKKQAEKLLMQYRTGSMTELRFSDMANTHSDDGDGTTGGLYENVYPGQMVEAFEAWCYDPSRNVGDTGLVETEFGWHIMYFVGQTSYTFRDYMLTNDRKIEDVSAWYEALLETIEVEIINDSFVNKDMVISK